MKLMISLACLLLVQVAMARWPANVPDGYNVAVQKLALEYAQYIQPNRTDFTSVCEALTLPNCSLYRATHAKPSKILDVHTNEALSIYVDAVRGSDATGNGTLSAPFKSFEQGLAAAHSALNTSGASISLVLRSGEYHLRQTVELDASYSGLQIVGYEGDDSPVISGGVPLIPTWNKYLVTPKGTIYVTDVPKNTPNFDQLFLAGKRLIRAKYPNGDPEDFDETNSLAGWARTDGSVAWKQRVPLSLPTKVVNVTKWDGSFVPPDPGVEGYLLRVLDPMCVNCSSHGGESKYYEAVVGGSAAARYDPPHLIGPPRAHMHATELPDSVQIQQGFNGDFDASKWTNPSTGYMVAMQSNRWGSWWWPMDQVNISAVDNSTTVNFGPGGWQIGQGGGDALALYVENILEELDDVSEWFYDPTLGKLYMMPSPYEPLPRALTAVRADMPVLLHLTDNVSSVTLRGLTFTHSAMTVLQPYHVPSCGDWAIGRLGAVLLEGGSDINIETCMFTRTGGNAVYLKGKNTRVLIDQNDFEYTGDSAIALVGETNFIDGTAMDVPRDTTITGNLARELGVYGKQVSFVHQSYASRSVISHNIMFNQPRACVNFNDNAFGGSRVSQNLMFNCVRETGDHGAFNSWGRNVYLTPDTPANNPNNPNNPIPASASAGEAKDQVNKEAHKDGDNNKSDQNLMKSRSLSLSTASTSRLPKDDDDSRESRESRENSRNGSSSIVPSRNHLVNNFVLSNCNSIFPFDHDDGSAFYSDEFNFFSYAPAKNLFGHDKIYANNLYAYPDATNSYGYYSAYNSQSAFIGDSGYGEQFINNTVYMLGATPYSYEGGVSVTCDANSPFTSHYWAHTEHNSFYLPNGTEGFQGDCSPTMWTFQQWQQLGFDRDSTVQNVDLTQNGVDKIINEARTLLWV